MSPLTKRKPRSNVCGSTRRRQAATPESCTSPSPPGIGAPIGLDEVKRYRDAGVHQVVIGTIPRDPKTVQGDIERLAEKIVAPSAKL